MIGADLEPVGRTPGRPYPLRENEGIGFQGSIVLGMGFTMSADQAQELLVQDVRNARVLRPYLGGQDVNQRPDSSPGRWVINFRDWSLERAEEYPELLDIVRRLVKPERDGNKMRERREFWWRFIYPGLAMHKAIDNLEDILVLSWTSSVVMPVRVPASYVYSNSCVVFALEGLDDLAVLSSSIHTTWVVRYASTLRTDIRYAPSDVFLTLPRPQNTPELARLGERLNTERRELMLGRAWGLTTTYNAIHNPAVTDLEIVNLREIHEAIDVAVLDAYGWSDLDPQVGHHSTKIGTRWTVSREARFELLDRLLEENHRRHALQTP